MSTFKNAARSFAINTYRCLTTPTRRRAAERALQTGTVPIHALFYHRVADHTLNDWTMSIKQFEKQISWLSANFEFISLSEAQQRIREGNNTKPSVVLTFDDGYADNSQHALPMLIKRRIPFTYFVCLQNMLTSEPFPHDVAAGKPLGPHDVDSIRMLASSPLIEIGAHTRRHADIGKLTDPQKVFDEVVKASQEMEEIIQRPMRYFAFPFGKHENMTAAVFHLLKEHGFDGVCSAYGGLNEIGGDPFHIQRLHGDPVFARIRNWLTGDPRIAKAHRFDYQVDEETRLEMLEPFEAFVKESTLQTAIT